jgi:predicted dehydrogenase/aryl-alcohol dehydrogenase-like predicted oxidoreductase
LGTGGIAKAFAQHLKKSKTGKLVAVGSRTAESAKKFADEFGGIRAHATYDAILADAEVQALYIATPHPYHSEWAIKAAEAGKHLLVEKPLGMNWPEVEAVIEAALANKVFLMEAFMYRCHPQTAKLVQLLRDKAIGEVRVIQANFGFHWPKPYDAKSRLIDPNLGGGGILDVGCYPISMVRLIAGVAQGRDFADPTELVATGVLGQTGVDEWTIASLKFPGNILASCSTSVQVNQESVLRIFGSDGSIFVPDPWVPSRNGGQTKITLNKNGEKPQEIVVDSPLPIYALEADAVAEHLGKLQSPTMNWDDSLGNAKALDQWRKAIKLQYPNEKADAFPPSPARREVRLPSKIGKTPVIPSGTIVGVDKPISKFVMGLQGDTNLAAALFDAYVELGGNAFDTSWWYGQGHTDKVLGKWMKSRGVRKDMVVIAKGAHTPGCYPKELTRQLLESLKFLETDYADIYVMHRDNEDIPIGEFVEVLNEHKKAGRIKVFGGSNWSLARVKAFNEYADQKGLSRMSVISNNFSLARMINPVWAGCVSSKGPEYEKWLADTKTTLLIWSSQARGFFVRGNVNDKSDGELVNSWYGDDNFERKKRAEELAAKIGGGITANNVALAYTMAQPFPSFCLIGPANLKELRTTLPALNVKLTPGQCKWLNLES